MKKNRLLLIMQLAGILPVIVFLFVYIPYTLYSLFATVVLFILLLINIYRYINHIRLIRYPLILILIGSFLLYGFYGLGSTYVPQKFEQVKAGSSVTLFDFKKPTNIDKMCYYVGIDKNVKFSLEQSQQNRWRTFYTNQKSYPYSFKWICVKKWVKTSKILLRIIENQMMLGEVIFMYKDHVIPYQTSKKLLNDEQNISIDTSYYSGMFFDEIYHGRTAYEIMHGLNVYENTHPYLGKLLILPGIKVFGMTPFGWRFTNVLFAALLILVAYYFALQLFKKRLFAFSAAFLMTYSFMHLTQSRLALIDTFGVLFVFISYDFLYRFIKKQQLSSLLWSGVFFGLASAVKWAAVFSSIGFVLIAFYLILTRYPLDKRFAGYRLILYGLLSYGILAPSVYILTFFDIYAHTGSFQSIINYNLNMFHYHSGITATHPYSSDWWSWPIDLKPMCYYREIHDKIYSTITVFGNPAIFWVGIIALFYLVVTLFKRHTLEASFILFAFLGLYLPYIFIGRLMFIYHFYYAVPFMMLAIVYLLKDLVKYFSLYRKYYFLYPSIVLVLFLMFYPVLSGYGVPETYINHTLKWFSGWWF